MPSCSLKSTNASLSHTHQCIFDGQQKDWRRNFHIWSGTSPIKHYCNKGLFWLTKMLVQNMNSKADFNNFISILKANYVFANAKFLQQNSFKLVARHRGLLALAKSCREWGIERWSSYCDGNKSFEADKRGNRCMFPRYQLLKLTRVDSAADEVG